MQPRSTSLLFDDALQRDDEHSPGDDEPRHPLSPRATAAESYAQVVEAPGREDAHAQQRGRDRVAEHRDVGEPGDVRHDRVQHGRVERRADEEQRPRAEHPAKPAVPPAEECAHGEDQQREARVAARLLPRADDGAVRRLEDAAEDVRTHELGESRLRDDDLGLMGHVATDVRDAHQLHRRVEHRRRDGGSQRRAHRREPDGAQGPSGSFDQPDDEPAGAASPMVKIVTSGNPATMVSHVPNAGHDDPGPRRRELATGQQLDAEQAQRHERHRVHRGVGDPRDALSPPRTTTPTSALTCSIFARSAPDACACAKISPR